MDVLKKSQFAFRAVLISLALLWLIVTLATLVMPGCGRSPNIIIWALHCVPLLIVLPGVLRGSPRAHIWLCFLSLGYFTVAVTGAFACWSSLALLEVFAVVAVFISAMLYARWRAQSDNRKLNNKG